MSNSVSYIYNIVDKYSGPLKKIAAATDRVTQKVAKARTGMKKFGDKMTNLSGVAASLGGVVAGRAMLGTFVNFEDAMNSLSAVSLTTDDRLKALRDRAKELGRTTQFTATEVSEGMVLLRQSGMSIDKIFGAIPNTLQLAAAATLTMAEAAQISTKAMDMFGLETTELSRVNDVLANTQANANTNVRELFEALRPVGATAKNLGLSIEEVAAALGVIANKGESGAIAGTLFRNALMNISKAASKHGRIYKTLGVDLTLYTDRLGQLTNFKGFIGKMRELQDQGRLTIPILQKLFGERGFRSMQLLMSAGTEEIAKMEQQVSVLGTSGEMATRKMRGLPGKIKELKSAVEGLTIALFESGLADFLVKVTKKLTDIARRIAKVNPKILALTGVLGTLTIALTAGAVAAGLLATPLAALVSLPGAIAVGITVLVAGLVVWYQKNERMRLAVDNLWHSLKTNLGPAVRVVSKLVQKLWKWLGGGESIMDGLTFTVEVLGFALHELTKPIKLVFTAFENLMNNGFIEWITSATDKLSNFLGIEDRRAKGLERLKSQAEGGKQGLYGARVQQSRATVDGQINVTATGGAKVQSGYMTGYGQSNLGFNLGQ